MDRQRILLNAKTPMGAVCLLPLVSWLRRDHQLEMRFTSRWRGTRWRPGRLLQTLPRSHRAYQGIRPIPAPLASATRFDLYLSPDMTLTGTRRTRTKIHLFHGVSFKGASISPKALVHDLLFLFGEYQRRRFVEKGIVEEGDPRLVVIGWPKLDCLVDGSLSAEEVRGAMGLAAARPTVLYAPTWRGTSLDTAGEAIVDAIADMDVNLLIKLHDHSLDRGLTRRRWDRTLAAWRERPNVFIHTDPDICPALMAADLLVSDFSSAANEFTLLDRPIVHFDTPDLKARYSQKQIDHAMLERRPGPVTDRADALPELITHALAHPEEFSAERQALAADLFHCPGTAAHRAVAKIYEVLGCESPLPTQWAFEMARGESPAIRQPESRG